MGTPYAGNPDSFPDDITILSGSDAPSSTNLNTPSEGLADRTAWLRKRAGLGALDFGPVSLSTAILATSWNAVFTCAKWDPINRAWIVAGLSAADGSGHAAVYQIPNGFADGSFGALSPLVSSSPNIGPVGVVVFDVLFDGTNYVAAGVVGGEAVVFICAPGGAWSGPFVDTSTTVIHATVHQLGTTLLLAYSKSTRTSLWYSNDHGATWTNITMAIGGAYTGGVGELIVDDGTNALVLCSTATLPYYFKGTSSPGSWATFPAPWGTDVPMGATYATDSAGSAFFVVTAPSGGGMNTWRSSDGVSWAQVGGLNVTVTPTSLTSIDSVLAVTGSVSGGVTTGVFVSSDGGLTWRAALASPLVDSSAFADLRPGVVASDCQLMAFWQTGARWSRVFLPPASAS